MNETLDGFKVGDSVKILRIYQPYSQDLVGKVGNIVTIAPPQKQDCRIAVNVGERIWVNSDEIEHVEQEKSE